MVNYGCAFALAAMVLVLPTLVAADEVTLAAAPELRLQDSFLFTGHLAVEGATLTNVTLINVEEAAFDGGSLTVCPLRYQQGRLVAILAELSPLCPNGVTHDVTNVSFDPATRLLTSGEATMGKMPAATLSTWTGGNQSSMAMLAAGSTTLVFPDSHRFAPLNVGAVVRVSTPEGVRMYNGTDYAFFHDGTQGTWHVGGMGAFVSGQPTLSLGPAGAEAVGQLPSAFGLLDVQEALLGPDVREPRRNVSQVVGLTARAPHLADGTLAGKMEGAVGGITIDADVSVIRFSSLHLGLTPTGWYGTGDANLILGTQGVALDGRGMAHPPWFAIAFLWLGVLVVATLRRHFIAPDLWSRLLGAATAVAGWSVLDFWILPRSVGIGTVGALGVGDVALAASLAVFEVATILVAWWGLLVPGRIIVLRLLRPEVDARWVRLARVATHGAWTLWIWFASATFLALGHAVARL